MMNFDSEEPSSVLRLLMKVPKCGPQRLTARKNERKSNLSSRLLLQLEVKIVALLNPNLRVTNHKVMHIFADQNTSWLQLRDYLRSPGDKNKPHCQNSSRGKKENNDAKASLYVGISSSKQVPSPMHRNITGKTL